MSSDTCRAAGGVFTDFWFRQPPHGAVTPQRRHETSRTSPANPNGRPGPRRGRWAYYGLSFGGGTGAGLSSRPGDCSCPICSFAPSWSGSFGAIQRAAEVAGYGGCEEAPALGPGMQAGWNETGQTAGPDLTRALPEHRTQLRHHPLHAGGPAHALTNRQVARARRLPQPTRPTPLS